MEKLLAAVELKGASLTQDAQRELLLCTTGAVMERFGLSELEARHLLRVIASRTVTLPPVQTVWDMLHQVQSQPISTTIAPLDAALHGGFQAGSLAECMAGGSSLSMLHTARRLLARLALRLVATENCSVWWLHSGLHQRSVMEAVREYASPTHHPTEDSILFSAVRDIDDLCTACRLLDEANSIALPFPATVNKSSEGVELSRPLRLVIVDSLPLLMKQRFGETRDLGALERYDFLSTFVPPWKRWAEREKATAVFLTAPATRFSEEVTRYFSYAMTIRLALSSVSHFQSPFESSAAGRCSAPSPQFSLKVVKSPVCEMVEVPLDLVKAREGGVPGDDTIQKLNRDVYADELLLSALDPLDYIIGLSECS